MIVQIKGKLLDKKPSCLVIDVAGLAYEVHVPITTFFKMGPIHSETHLYTHQVFREDSQNLYGFWEKFERDFYKLLLKVNGVGPKLGLAILSNMSAIELMQVIEQEDVSRLVSLPGIGKKTASKLLIDLRDKLKSLEMGESFFVAKGEGGAQTQLGENSSVQDAIFALVSLGYKQTDASKVVLKIVSGHKENPLSVEQLITKALKSISVS